MSNDKLDWTTPLDRFTASHPNWRDLDKEDAVRLALEQRGEG